MVEPQLTEICLSYRVKIWFYERSLTFWIRAKANWVWGSNCKTVHGQVWRWARHWLCTYWPHIICFCLSFSHQGRLQMILKTGFKGRRRMSHAFVTLPLWRASGAVAVARRYMHCQCLTRSDHKNLITCKKFSIIFFEKNPIKDLS